MTLLDIMEGRQLRNSGCDIVLANQGEDWMDAYCVHADQFIQTKNYGDTFIGEDIRRYISPRIPSPAHPNAWGAAARKVLTRWKKDGRIAECGMGTSKSPKSHATRQVMYRVMG